MLRYFGPSIQIDTPKPENRDSIQEQKSLPDIELPSFYETFDTWLSFLTLSRHWFMIEQACQILKKICIRIHAVKLAQIPTIIDSLKVSSNSYELENLLQHTQEWG